MAKIIGKAGRFQGDQLLKRSAIFITALLIVGPIIGFIAGAVAVYRSHFLSLCMLAVMLPFFWWAYHLAIRQVRQMDVERRALRGEIRVGSWLEDLPDTYTVINDLTFADSYGNIDHLVVGPTGVFAIDTKNWKGVVTADGKGDVLLNGKSPSKEPGKSEVKRFTARAMDLRDRIRALTGLEPFIHVLFVFPIAYVEAKWGTTGAVNCLGLGNLIEYITKQNRSPLSRTEVEKIAKSAEMLGAATLS
jgi:hypothetical protein